MGATEEAARNIRYILDHYCRDSGQLVNYHKFEVQFSKSTSKTLIMEISDISQITPSNGIGTCIGCSNVDQKKNKVDFEVIKNKLVHELASWKARVLLHACKLVLIKSNLTGIPQFSMNWSNIQHILIRKLTG